MPVRIPPIAALRAFEAASRHLSYTKAAKELYVTQSAVSHQIRHAEELWDLKLFERRGRQLILTEAGQTLQPIIRDFILNISSTVEQLQNQDSERALRVTLLESFAFKWLVPRLGHFNKAHPNIGIWLSTSEELTDFSADKADVGIRLGAGNWDKLHKEQLLTEYVFPVCSPQFIEEYGGTPESPEALLHYPLLRRGVADICPRWKDWFKSAGIDIVLMAHGVRFPSTALAVQAAIDNQGVALARSAHAMEDLKAGRLVQLFPDIVSRSPVEYYFICTEGRQQEPDISAFYDWVKVESEITQKEYDDYFTRHK